MPAKLTPKMMKVWKKDVGTVPKVPMTVKRMATIAKKNGF